MTVRVEEFAELSVMAIVVGLKLDVESFERPDTLNEIVPVKPPIGVAVTVKVVLPPGLMVRELGVIETEYSAVGETSEIFAMKTSCPPAFEFCRAVTAGKFAEAV